MSLLKRAESVFYDPRSLDFRGKVRLVVLGNRVIDLLLNHQALSRLVCEAVYITSHNENSLAELL